MSSMSEWYEGHEDELPDDTGTLAEAKIEGLKKDFEKADYDTIKVLAEDKRIEAIWRAKITHQVLAYADQLHRESPSTGVKTAVYAILQDAASRINIMSD